MIKAFVFDIGNVVWDFKPLCDQLFNAWAKMLNLPYDKFWEEYLKVCLDFETDNIKLDDWVQKLNPQSNPQEFYVKAKEIMGDKTIFSSYLNQSVIELISKLKTPQTKVGCLSNTEHYIYPYLQENILPVFDFSILSWQVKDRKPNLSIYQQIFNFGDWQPDETVFIDDRLENVVAAKDAGINGILFQDFQQLQNDIFLLQK